MIYTSDLRTLSSHNVIVKYTDDTTLLVGQHSSVDITQEYEDISSWSVTNKLTINTGKTKEIVFHRPASRHLNIPRPLLGIERVTEATLLGIDITSSLSTSVLGVCGYRNFVPDPYPTRGYTRTRGRLPIEYAIDESISRKHCLSLILRSRA